MSAFLSLQVAKTETTRRRARSGALEPVRGSRPGSVGGRTARPRPLSGLRPQPAQQAGLLPRRLLRLVGQDCSRSHHGGQAVQSGG